MKKLLFLLIALFFLPFFPAAQKWTLQQCVDTALKNNLSIQQSYNALYLSEMDLQQSRWNRFPSLNGATSQNFSFGRSLDQSTYQYNNRSASTNNFSLNTGMVLFNGGLLKHAIQQNELNVEAAHYDLQAVKDAVSLNVINDFVSILFGMEAVNNAQLQAASTQELIRQTQLFVQAGKKAESDVAQLKSQAASEQYNLATAEGQLRTANLGLQQLMDVPYAEEFEIAAPSLAAIENNILPKAGDVFQTALQLQPSVKSSETKIKVEQMGLKLAQAGLLPKLSLNAGLSSSYSNIRNLTSVTTETTLQTIGFLKDNTSQQVLSYVQNNTYTLENYPFFKQLRDNFNQYVSLNVSIPVFNARQVRNNITRSEIAIHQAQLNDRLSKNSLRKNIEQASVDAANAQMRYYAAKEAVATEEISYNNVQLLFEASKATSIDLLVEKNKYAVVQSQLLQAKYDLVLKLKVLDYYEGKPLYLR